jgi:hypothetical protein
MVRPYESVIPFGKSYLYTGNWGQTPQDIVKGACGRALLMPEGPNLPILLAIY